MASCNCVTAMILAGGLGTRLREVIAYCPKVLAPVNGRPFLSFLLDRLAGAGIKRVILCTGFMAEMVQNAFGENYLGMELRYSREETPLGTGGALRLALPLADSNPVLVMNGDSFCDADLGMFLKQHSLVSALASLVLVHVPDISRYGAVDMNGTGLITSFVEKGTRKGGGMINAGIYLLDRQVLESIPLGVQTSLERDIFPGLISHGIFGFTQCARFIDIGIPSDYHAATGYMIDDLNSSNGDIL